MNKDDMTYDNPYDESFYIVPEDTEETETEEGTDIAAGDTGSTSEFVIDLAGVSTKEEFHDRVREGIKTPDYYGNNLDALYDILTEDYDGKTIKVSGWDKAASEMRDYIGKFRKMCCEVCDEYEEIKIIFSEDKG